MLAALVIAAVAASASSRAGGPSACDALVQHARTVMPAAWASGEKALAPVLKIEQQTSISDADKPPGPAWRPLAANLPMIRKALDDDEGLIWAERLGGTDVFLAFTVQGTLECQNAVFLQVRPGRPPKVVSGPKAGAAGDAELCWSRSGDFGTVFGRPAFIAHGPPDFPEPDDEIEITPWTGSGWGPTCKAVLRFRTDYQVAERYCGDLAVCKSAGAIAREAAAAYNREESSTHKSFGYGPPPAAAAKAAVGRVRAKLSDTDTPDFPTFGKGSDEHPFSYSNFVLFPLMLGGRAYAAAIGHQGVGWRESPDTLFAVYQVKGTELTPLAGFVVSQSVTGLASATAGPAPKTKGRGK